MDPGELLLLVLGDALENLFERESVSLPHCLPFVQKGLELPAHLLEVIGLEVPARVVQEVLPELRGLEDQLEVLVVELDHPLAVVLLLLLDEEILHSQIPALRHLPEVVPEEDWLELDVGGLDPLGPHQPVHQALERRFEHELVVLLVPLGGAALPQQPVYALEGLIFVDQAFGELLPHQLDEQSEPFFGLNFAAHLLDLSAEHFA